MNLHTFVKAANGMLPLPVYDEIYRLAGQAAGENFVEIGTAHGAATIALALGGASREPKASVWTVDRLGGKFSSRSRFGSADDNKKVVMENFRRAGVADQIHLFVGSSDEFVASEECPAQIHLLMLDADGRIDRDLNHFYQRMSPGTPIIIDDVDENVYLNRNHEGTPYVDLKHRITNLLLAAYVSEGFLRVVNQRECTAFCQRGAREFDEQLFLKIALSCYRELVFADVRDPFWEELVSWKENGNSVREALRIRSALPTRLISAARKIRQIGKKISSKS